MLSPDQEDRRSDPGEQVALVGLGHQQQLLLERLGSDRGGDLREQRDEHLRWLGCEQSGKGGIELLGGRGEHFVCACDTRTHFFLRQGSLPARVGVYEDERPDELGVVAVELLYPSAAPREARDVRWAERERVDQRPEAVCVVRQTEARRHIGGMAGARLVPGDDRELVGEGSELRLPDAAVLTGAMDEHERRSLADALIRNVEPVEPDDVHWSKNVQRL